MLKKNTRGEDLMLRSRSLWIIASHMNNRREVLTIDPDNDGGSFLVVFSFEEEAQTYLALLDDEERKKGWSMRQTAPGELISVLLAPCAPVKGVALDPLPPLPFREGMSLMTVKHASFIRYLMEERKERSGEIVAA
jgi:hypothetical protein